VTLTTYRRLTAAEWTKLRSLRSTTWTLSAMVVFSIGLGALICALNAAHWSSATAAERATWDPTNTSLAGTLLGQIAIGVLGVLAVTGEYASGTIRASLTAVPRRTRWLVAKGSVYGLASLVIGEIVSFASFLIGQAIFSGRVPNASLASFDVVRAVGLAGVYLALICLIGMGLGTIMRHTAGAISTIVAVLLVIPAILEALPSGIQNSLERFLPDQIGGGSMAVVVPEAHYFGPLAGTALLCGYTVAILAAAAAVLRRRDV
jgi:ABC-2 type transport system permease protein